MLRKVFIVGFKCLVLSLSVLYSVVYCCFQVFIVVKCPYSVVFLRVFIVVKCPYSVVYYCFHQSVYCC